MNHKVFDYPERQKALSLESSFIVQAPAGSGKTELLIQRYLRLLAMVESPEEIIAITFTRKASAEMRSRIIKALHQARTGVQPEDDATRLTHEMAISVLARDKDLDWQLENNPGRLRIQTIDSLCAWLTRQMPLLSGLGAQPELLENATEIYHQAAANTLADLESGEHWSEAVARLLSHLDNDLPRVKAMIATLLQRRDQWLRHIGREIDRQELETAFQHAVASTLENIAARFPQVYQNEMLQYLRYAASNLYADKPESAIARFRDITQFPGSTATDLPVWRAIASLCLTGANQWRKRVDKTIGFPKPEADLAETETRKQMKDGFQSLLSRLSGDESLTEGLVEIHLLPPMHFAEDEWQIVKALCELLLMADSHLRVLFAERNQIDFNGIMLAAIDALGQDDNPTDLALRLDYRIKHLLIDEFQDVSNNQYKLIEKLTAGWYPGDGHTLFLVGDPMQSIYRFREAEVGLFINTWKQKRLGQIPLDPLKIEVNFRSQAGIVNWVNRAFDVIFPDLADSYRGSVSYEPAQAFLPETGHTAVQAHAVLDEIDEAKRITALIKNSRQQDPDRCLAILVRNRSHLLEITTHLRANNLAYKAVEIESLGHRPEIQDLLALTRALDHPADRIACFAVLRAPWCGITLDDLLLLGEKTQLTIWEAINAADRMKGLSADGRNRLAVIGPKLQHALEQRCRRTLRRSVESLWMNLGGPATLEDDSALENVEVFFDLLEDFDVGGRLSESNQFMEQVDNLFALPAHVDDRLQIMTIHKAKGLEFDVVILPELHRGSRSNESQLLLWAESPHVQHQDLLLAPIKPAGSDDSPFYDYLNELEKQKQDHELGRLLYVAATRARQELHLFAAIPLDSDTGEYKRPGKNSLLKHLWPVLEEEYKALAIATSQNSQIQMNQDQQAISSGMHRFTSDWRLPDAPADISVPVSFDYSAMPEVMPEYKWAGETIMHIGSVVHRFLQIIAEDGIERWTQDYIKSESTRFETSLRQLGVIQQDIDWATDQVIRALASTIEDETGRWILDMRHEQAACELPLTGIIDNRVVNVILDRTFIDSEDQRWIIDYKTSRHEGPDIQEFLDQEEERYASQLKKYAVLMQAMENRPVKLGLYFPLLGQWREINIHSEA